MKTADAVVSTFTGGKHLTWEERQKAGPVVHYAFGAIMGGLYGGLAEICPEVKSGLGATFGTALFTGADLIAVPVLKLGPALDEQPKRAQASPLAAHVIYGLSTEIVRKAIRALL
jgi:putative membrane protein